MRRQTLRQPHEAQFVAANEWESMTAQATGESMSVAGDADLGMIMLGLAEDDVHIYERPWAIRRI